MHNITGQKALPFFLLVPPGIVLLIHSYLGFFSRLMADDFCSYNDAQRFHILRYIWYSFNYWAGRYSAVASDEILDTIGPLGVRYIPLVVLMIWVTATCLMCHYALQKYTSNKPNLILSGSLGVILVFTVSATSPGFDKLLYWWNGMRTYIPALISLTFHIAFLYWAKERNFTRWNLLIASTLSFLFAFFSGGFNETFTTVQFLVFIGFTGLWILKKRSRLSDPIFAMLGAASVGAVLALIIMVISPGAAQRRALFSSAPPDVITMLEITYTGYMSYLREMFNSTAEISVWIGLTLAFIWAGILSEEKISGWWPVFLTLIGGFFLSFVSLLPSAYGLSGMPATRTFSVPTYVIILSLAYSGLLTGKILGSSGYLLSSKSIQTGLMLLVVAMVTFSSLIHAKTLYERREIYVEYAQQWDKVDSMIKQARSNGDASIIIPAMGGWAYLDRPNENPKFWATACYSEYYGIQIYGPPYDQ